MRSSSKQFSRIVILQNKSQAKRYHDKLKQKGDLVYPIGASSIFFCIDFRRERCDPESRGSVGSDKPLLGAKPLHI